MQLFDQRPVAVNQSNESEIPHRLAAEYRAIAKSSVRYWTPVSPPVIVPEYSLPPSSQQIECRELTRGGYNSAMNSIPLRTQLRLVAAGYAAVLATAAILVYMRHLMYINHAAEAAAAGGMYAAGDWMLEIIIGCMFLVPTFVLALVIRKSEPLYTAYSKVMLGLSLTAPISLGLITISAVSQGTMLLGWICLDRLLCSPVVIMGLAGSRLLARFDRAKRLTLYALLIEVLTLALMVALFLFTAMKHGG